MNTEVHFAEVSVKGKLRKVPAVSVGGRTIVAEGGWLKIASYHDENWLPDCAGEPEEIVSKLKQSKLKADIFTFAEKLPHTKPRFDYPVEWDNVAAIPITTFTEWWENRVPQETRKNVRRAGRRGVTTQIISLDDSVAAGLKRIYDETPVRQGRKFWHYGKDVQTVKRENSSYLDSSEFIGAFFDGSLIGLLKMVYVGKTANIMQIISENKHYDKRPANALLAKAMETCAQKGMEYFVYGQYVYGSKTDDPLAEFKRRNGFEMIMLPRYFIPLTAKGRMAMRLKLHLGMRRLLPRKLESALQTARARMLDKNSGRQAAKEPEPCNAQ